MKRMSKGNLFNVLADSERRARRTLWLLKFNLALLVIDGVLGIINLVK